jgi:hypothetical protein
MANLRKLQGYRPPMSVRGFAASYLPEFTHKPDVINHADHFVCDFVPPLLQLAARRGVETYEHVCLSAAHTAKDMGDTLGRADDARET